MKRWLLVAALLLFVPGCGGIVYYLVTGGEEQVPELDDFTNTKRYQRDLEMYGGKINILADDFRRWFQGLWHGRTLFLTLGCLALALSLACFLASRLDGLNGDSPR